jgi:hypothetical protein
MERLFQATLSARWEGDASREAGGRLNVASSYDLWWTDKEVGQLRNRSESAWQVSRGQLSEPRLLACEGGQIRIGETGAIVPPGISEPLRSPHPVDECLRNHRRKGVLFCSAFAQQRLGNLRGESEGWLPTGYVGVENAGCGLLPQPLLSESWTGSG